MDFNPVESASLTLAHGFLESAEEEPLIDSKYLEYLMREKERELYLS